MSDLIPFSQIDPDNDGSRWSDDQIEASEFLHKLDYEGGISALMNYGGPSYFPPELRDLAVAYEIAQDRLSIAIDRWAADRGVIY